MIEMTPLEIDALLAEARIGRLCMADASGRPYAIPLPFYWDGRALYLRLPLTGRKGDILRQNDRVCFEVDAFTDTLDTYASIIIEGRLMPVEDVNEKQRIKLLNTAKYERLRQGHRPGHGRSKTISELPMRKIAVEQIAGRRKEPEMMVEQWRHPAQREVRLSPQFIQL
jgi:nitroimidazol reductase NimA-like FMN-containing flavoprotein (pyridoxamine 5'-phosphate oxidase superfamily)